MRPITGIERFVLGLAILFIVVGLLNILWPQKIDVPHVSLPTGKALRADNYVEHLSEEGSRRYGVVAVMVGAMLGALSLCRRKR
jgi:hypothetical protein